MADVEPKFPFNEPKAIQVAAYVMRRTGTGAGHAVKYMKLLKLMYFAEREALARWGAPICGGSYVSMDYGPVMSEVYDRIRKRGRAVTWARSIKESDGYLVSLASNPGADLIPEAERELLDQIVGEHGGKSEWTLSSESHELCPEWRDPSGSSLPITYKDILKATRRSGKLRQVRAQAKDLRTIDSLFGPAMPVAD